MVRTRIRKKGVKGMKDFDIRYYNYEKHEMITLSSYTEQDGFSSLLDFWSIYYHLKPEMRSELMLWTGLYDKVGKKIFEGDFIKSSLKYIFEVQYYPASASFTANGKDEYRLDIGYVLDNATKIKTEIIGNICEKEDVGRCL